MTIEGDILGFWFGSGERTFRQAWFEKNPAFDDEIRQRFAGAIADALLDRSPIATDTPTGALATILLLDQFTRNIWRDTPRAFIGDGIALALADRAVEAGLDRALHPIERVFVYLPFEHAESLTEQERSVALYAALAQQAPGDKVFAEVLDYAERHEVIIRRFGRFPHRNAILGRRTTAEEAAFLQQPNSSF